MKIIGERIKEIRLSKRLTQEELADKLELTKSYISKLENGITIPSIYFLYNLADIFEVTIQDFFGETNRTNNDNKWTSVNDYFDNHNISPDEVLMLFNILRKLK
ncbi:helix-turn-helix domain-containing protein [Peribacillus loiseleuriae]|uniref:helix-turn-helix domain-containing protein n=1 Tax=Peribacillus loiseleuriae TaxID=1679170 RepID=UPI00069FDDAF|nr:helix-turn-helix transcriptional regulator [Peribacillus loiseleuriae]